MKWVIRSMLVVLVGHIHESHVAGKSTIFCVWIDV